MKNCISVFFCIVMIFVAVGKSLAAQAQGKDDYVIFNGIVADIEGTNLAEGVADAYHFVDYNVLKVCHGELSDTWLRVEHIVGTAKGLHVGDIVCRRVKRTDKFRKYREDLFDFGIDPSDAFMADYEFWGYNVPCSCE